MKVLINSNGSLQGTYVFDQDGRAIKGNITKIEWVVEANKPARATVTLEDVELSSPAEMFDPLGR